MSRSSSASAISPLPRATTSASGTPAAAQRAGSAVHFSGRNRRSPTGTGTSRPASVRETSALPLAFLPSGPQYSRATPTDSAPLFRSAVSSTTSAPPRPPTRPPAGDRPRARRRAPAFLPRLPEFPPPPPTRQRPFLRQRRVAAPQPPPRPPHQRPAPPGRPPPQRRVVPGRAGDEVLQLVVPG